MNILRAAVLIWIAAVEVLSFSGRLTTFSRNLFRVSDRTNNVKLHQIGGSFNRDMAPVGTFTENIKGGVFSSIINIAHLFKVICVDVYDYIVNLVRGDDSSKLISQFYSGKCIVVTGASSGIGEALAMTLSSIPDTTVVISARSLEKLEEIASACKSQYPNSRVLPVTLDLEQYEHLGEYKDRLIAVLDKNGLSERVDVLINNAGISSRGTALDTSMETLEKLMVSNHLESIDITTV